MKILRLVILLVALSAIAFGAYFLFSKSGSAPEEEKSGVSSVLPGFFKKKEVITNEAGAEFKEGETVTVRGIEGDVEVSNFYKEAPFITKRGDAEIAVAEEYRIGYVSDPPYFTISITSENIDDATRNAENRLVSLLGIRKSDLCKLKVIVGVEKSFDPEGKRLGARGLSFCPSQ